MADYNFMNPVMGSNTIKHKFTNYMESSLDPIMGSSLYEQMFYREDIPAVDPKTNKRWSKTFKVSKPQGPGGYAKYTEEMMKGSQQGGYLGLMVPNDQEFILGTEWNYASIGRTFMDKLNDTNNFYEAVVAAEFGPHIREQQLEEIKTEIFTKGIKTFAGGAADEDALTATSTLTYAEIKALAESVETYEVNVIDNRKRVATDFVNAVKSVHGSVKGANALKDLNVIDFEAFQSAQEAFETAGLRTYRWTAPRFTISGIESDNYKTTNVNAREIKFTAPALKDLFNKDHPQQDAHLPVLVSKEGFTQLMEDEDLRAELEVSGYGYDTGYSGRFDRFIRKNKTIDVGGLLIINMEQDYIHGATASDGIDFGQSKNASGIQLATALIATPGYNFITTSSDFGTRTTYKPLEQTDMIDRMGFHEFMYVTFPWKVEVMTRSSFNLLVHAIK